METIYVIFGTHKQKLYPCKMSGDFDLLKSLGYSPDDGVQIAGLTVKRLRLKVPFGIPGSATAFRNGVPLGDDAQVLPGDVIEFARRRASKKVRLPPQDKAAGDVELAPEEKDHDGSKLVLEDFTAKYKDKPCFLGNTKPFLLLERLNRTPGRPVSVSNLMDDIWGDGPVNEETIQKHVSDLRRKLRKIDGVTIDGKSVRGHYKLVLS